MLAAIGNNWANSVAALSYYVLIYVVANMAVFTIISVVEQNNGGKTNIDDYNGFYQTNPRLSFLMTLAMFSLGGIPPFAGMFSKFFIFMSGVNGADINTQWEHGLMGLYSSHCSTLLSHSTTILRL